MRAKAPRRPDIAWTGFCGINGVGSPNRNSRAACGQASAVPELSLNRFPNTQPRPPAARPEEIGPGINFGVGKANNPGCRYPIFRFLPPGPVHVALFPKPVNDVINGGGSIFLKDPSNTCRIEIRCMCNILDRFLGGPHQLCHIDLFNNVHHFLQREFGYLRDLL